VVLIASGPSLTKEDVEAVKGKARAVAINNSHELAHWADLLYACDLRWWQRYKPEFSGMKYCPHEGACKEFGLTYVRGVHRPGISVTPDKIHYGSNSGFQAMNLAVHLGAKRILLLGYDMGFSDGRRHWHEDHKGIGNPDKNSFRRWLLAFQEAKPQLEKLGIEVVNCSRKTALTVFRQSTIEREL
jgi:hypothetical protein